MPVLLTLVSGAIIGYVSRLWRWIFWNVSIPLDSMGILVQENERLGGKNIKFVEDRVDRLNPTQDSGMLINKSWIATYLIVQKKDESKSFYSEENSVLSYSVSTPRLFRNKILNLLDKAMVEKASDRENKIFIVNSSSVFYVGEINSQYSYIPKVIEERLDSDRKTRLNIFLYGPVGTGKTTMAKTIAHKLGMPIYILAMDPWWNLIDFVKALQRIPDDSVILMDDIDLILEQILRVKEDDNAGIPIKLSTATIMAFLDGILMKEKRWIVIMCTNKPEKVKKLLRLRPGRVHISYKCTRVYSTDYIEATQEAEKLLKEIKQKEEE